MGWPMPAPCAGTPQRTPHGITIRKRNRMRVHPGAPGRPGVLTCSIRRLFPVCRSALSHFYSRSNIPRVIEVRKIAMRCAVPVAAPARGARGCPARRAPARRVVESVPAGTGRPRDHDTTCTTSTESSAPHRTTPDRLALHTRGVGVLITRTCARLFTRRAHHGPERDAGGQLRSDPSSDVGRIGLPFVWEPACEQLLLLGYMPVPREERSVVAGPRSPGFVRNRNTAEV